MEKKNIYLEILRQEVLLKLKGDPDLQMDHDGLLDLYASTGIALSTLKRIYNIDRSNPGYYPSPSTLHKLARYAGHENFNQFVKCQNEKRGSNPVESTVQQVIAIPQEHPQTFLEILSRPVNNLRSRTWISWMAMDSAFLVFIFLIWALPAQSSFQPSPVDTNPHLQEQASPDFDSLLMEAQNKQKVKFGGVQIDPEDKPAFMKANGEYQAKITRDGAYRVTILEIQYGLKSEFSICIETSDGFVRQPIPCWKNGHKGYYADYETVYKGNSFTVWTREGTEASGPVNLTERLWTDMNYSSAVLTWQDKNGFLLSVLIEPVEGPPIIH